MAVDVFSVEWSEEDQEYVGTCDRFPSLSYLHPNKDGALLGILDLVDAVESDIQN